MGRPEGALGDGVPVYDFALPLLRRLWPDEPPVRVIEVKMPKEAKYFVIPTVRPL